MAKIKKDTGRIRLFLFEGFLFDIVVILHIVHTIVVFVYSQFNNMIFMFIKPIIIFVEEYSVASTPHQVKTLDFF